MDIGLEIKILRERKRLSSKELAEKVGLSPSQMSRLEKGERRIDTQILDRIAKALDVPPAFFFQEGEPVRREFDPAHPFREMGKMVRLERRKRHLTLDDVAKRIGKTKAFAQALEDGKHPIDPELAGKLARALKLDPNTFLTAQDGIVRALQERVNRLEAELSERTMGTIPVDADAAVAGGAEAARRTGVPILGSISAGYPDAFDGRGLPVDTIDEYVFIPDLDPDQCFALYARGDSMVQDAVPSFQEGDIVVFSSVGAIRNRDFAFARLSGAPPNFRQVFFDPNGTIRLQPLNRGYPPLILAQEEIIRMWRLVAHVSRT